MVILIVALGLLCAVGIPTMPGIDSTIMNAGRAFVFSMLLLAGLAVLIDLQKARRELKKVQKQIEEDEHELG